MYLFVALKLLVYYVPSFSLGVMVSAGLEIFELPANRLHSVSKLDSTFYELHEIGMWSVTYKVSLISLLEYLLISDSTQLVWEKETLQNLFSSVLFQVNDFFIVYFIKIFCSEKKKTIFWKTPNPIIFFFSIQPKIAFLILSAVHDKISTASKYYVYFTL